MGFERTYVMVCTADRLDRLKSAICDLARRRRDPPSRRKQHVGRNLSSLGTERFRIRANLPDDLQKLCQNHGCGPPYNVSVDIVKWHVDG